MSVVKKVRDSNIELFRIFLMLMIIAHHYVVNSGIMELYDFSHVSRNQMFLELLGWGGKAGINCFLLVTGYFMCKQSFTWRKFLTLYLEVKFYTLLLPVIFWTIGKQELTFQYCFRVVFCEFSSMGATFTQTFLALFLLIPFINRLIHAMDKVSHARLLVLLLLFYTIAGTFFLNDFFEYIGWYVTVYLIGAYLRLYPIAILQDVKKCSLLVAITLALDAASILYFTYLNHSFNIYYFVADSNRILAILSAVALFSLFRSIDLGRQRWINSISSATFGIFLIHTQTNVREWLWYEVFRVKDFFESDYLWLHAILTISTVYVVCLFIDIIRQKLIEKPLFVWLDKRFPTLSNKVN